MGTRLAQVRNHLLLFIVELVDGGNDGAGGGLCEDLRGRDGGHGEDRLIARGRMLAG